VVVPVDVILEVTDVVTVLVIDVVRVEVGDVV
jgi:hypothetical protein